jgi:hypothetical protein
MVPAERTKGFVPRLVGFATWGFHMMITRAFAFGRSLLANDVGATSLRLAILIGLSSSAILVLVRIGTAVAMPAFGH